LSFVPPVSHQDLLDALDDSPDLRSVVGRIASLSGPARGDFVARVREDEELNLETRLWVLRIARNEPFLESARRRFGLDPASVHSALAGAISSVG
jgi:hypothetical protein